LVSLVSVFYCESVISAELAMSSMCSCHISTASLSCVLMQLQQLIGWKCNELSLFVLGTIAIHVNNIRK